MTNFYIHIYNLPKQVNFADGSYLQWDYRPDGKKVKSTSSEKYIRVTVTVNSKGDTIVRERTMYNTDMRKYIGAFEISGSTWRIYHDAGHTDLNTTSGALTHRYYVQDYLGSTRAVVDEDGNVLQSTAYYPSGVPLTPNSLTPQTIKLHTGKEFFDLQGAGWYDNQARYYDCLIPTFKSQDPLAEKYPWLSPYNHCANNPLRFVDRDGMRINLAKLQNYDIHAGTNAVDQIIGDLSIQTGLSLSIDDNGYLNYSSNSNGAPIITSLGEQLAGSVTARSHLQKLIDSSDCLIVKPGARSKADPNAINEIGLSSKQIQKFIDGATNVDSKTLGFGMTFLHESFHTKMGGNLMDDFSGTGDVVDIMNQIRKELNQLGYNYGKRTNYTSINVNGSIYIPMDGSSLNKLKWELTPDKDDLYIVFQP